MRALWIELLPYFIVHVVVIVSQALLNVFRCLGIVLKDDGNVHVDNDQKTDDQVGEQECDSISGISAVSCFAYVEKREIKLKSKNGHCTMRYCNQISNLHAIT